MSALIDILQSLAIAILAVGLLLTIRMVNRKPATVIREFRPGLPYEEPKAICGCEHHHCFHDEDGCSHTSQVQTFDMFRVEHYKSARCKCKRYTGPEPLPLVLP